MDNKAPISRLLAWYPQWIGLRMTDAADIFSCEGPVTRPHSPHQILLTLHQWLEDMGGAVLIKGDWAGEATEVGGGRTEKTESAVLPMSCTLIFFFPPRHVVSQ